MKNKINISQEELDQKEIITAVNTVSTFYEDGTISAQRCGWEEPRQLTDNPQGALVRGVLKREADGSYLFVPNKPKTGPSQPRYALNAHVGTCTVVRESSTKTIVIMQFPIEGTGNDKSEALQMESSLVGRWFRGRYRRDMEEFMNQTNA